MVSKNKKEILFAPTMRTEYHNKIVPAMLQAFNYSNVMQVPKIRCISINMGLGDAKNNSKDLESALGELSLISG